MHIHLDAVGGVAGDMFIAALGDARPDLRPCVLEAIRAAGVPNEIACSFLEHRDHALTGLRFSVDDPHEHSHRHAHDHGLHHEHDETSFASIRAMLQGSALDHEVKRRALHMFTLLAEVEGAVHGMPTEAVSFHELGGWDSIADIVGAAALIAALGEAHWSVSVLPLGRGRTQTAHGWLPVPSPAATRLLIGYEFFDDGLDGERVTPTGAAILKHLGAGQAAARSARRLMHTGHGFGTKTFPGISNVLRALAFEEQPQASASDRVALIAFEVDDQSPEDLAMGLDHLRAHPGVLDVVQMPAFGKKGRMTAHIQILADPSATEKVFAACFTETATLGLRWQVLERRVLTREQAMVEVNGHALRIKVAQRPGAHTTKIESDDLRAVPGGRVERDRLRREAQDERQKSDG